MAKKEAPGGDLWIPGLGWPSGLLRFAAIFVFDFFMSTSFQLYETAKDLDTLQNGPYNANILRTVQLAAKWSRIGYIWNLAAWIPTVFLPSFMVIVIGAFDLTIVGVLSNITVMGRQFLPANKGLCSQTSTWRASEDGAKNFFGDSTEPAVSARGTCEDFFWMHRYGFVALVIYGVICFFHIFLGLSMCLYAIIKHQPRYSLVHIARQPAHMIFVIFQLTLFSVTLILVLITLGLFSCLLPPSGRRPIYFVSSYRRKLLLRLPLSIRNFPTRVLDYTAGRIPIRPRPQNFLDLLRRKCKSTEKHGDDIEIQLPILRFIQAPIEKFLNMDILFLISQRLHYTDLWNLSFASKALRQFIFPPDAAHVRLLKLYCCRGRADNECWACFRPTCPDCVVSASYQGPTAILPHLGRCKMCCFKCIYNLPRPGKKCACGNGDEPVTRTLCNMCDAHTEQINSDRRRETESFLFARIVNQVDKCEECNGLLSARSPRWWICGTCHDECLDDVHPSWT